MTATRMPRVVLDEVVDEAGLRRLSASIHGDTLGMAEFGGFYGVAVARLGPLLGPDRRAWIVVADGGDAGFLDAEQQDGLIGLSWFVGEPWRGRGVGRGAVGRLLGFAPWPGADGYLAVMGSDNAASRALAASTGFVFEGLDEYGEERWRRELPRPRAGADDPRRFLDRGGRLSVWPVRPADLDAVLRLLLDEVLAEGEVVDEREMGVRLRRIVDDPAFARRLLVDHELVERTRTGSQYARVISDRARP